MPEPEATMFAWAPIPHQFRAIGTPAFSKLLFVRANVAVLAGIDFGGYGEVFGRIALFENRQRLRQARNIKAFLSGRNNATELRREDPNLAAAASWTVDDPPGAQRTPICNVPRV